MHIPGIAINASMLAPGIRIHAVHHAQIRAVHFIDDTLYFLL
jgi:hypothetical protein